ncbi:unnamed protein product [Closterium sp. NIES-53]
MASLRVLAFDHEGRPVAFDTWHDDLKLYLLSDIKDSVSIFDHALYDAIVARYSSPATAALGRLLLPYLFPELSAFATVADLVTHLRTSDARYRATVPAEFLATNQPPMFITLYFIVSRLPDSLGSVRNHFLSLDPTSLTIDLLEQHLLAAETSAVAVGAARGTPCLPFFEGCSPSPLSSSFASAAAADVSVTNNVGAVSTSAKRRSSKGKGGRGGGGGIGGGGGGNGSGGGGSGGGGGGSGGRGGGGTGGGSEGSGGSGGSGGGGTGDGRSGPRRGGPGGGQRQQQQRESETQSPEQLPRLQLRERFGTDLPVLRLHSDRGGVFSSDLLRDFCRGEGILQSFTLPDSPQQNGIAERRIGLVMEVARTSMVHAAAPHFLRPFAVRYAAHQLSLWPHVSLPETSPTLRWTGKVGDALVFRCRVLPSLDVTFDESVPFYNLFPYRSAPPLPPPLFLAPGPLPVDPLPPQGTAPSGVSQVDPLPGTAPVQVALGLGVDLGTASGGATSRGAEPGGAGSEGAGSGGAKPEGVEPGGADSVGAESGGAAPRGAASSGGPASASSRLSSLSSSGGLASASPRLPLYPIRTTPLHPQQTIAYKFDTPPKWGRTRGHKTSQERLSKLRVDP